MSTMAMPLSPYILPEFECAEKKVVRVDAGLTFAQGMGMVVRTAFALVHVTSALHAAVAVQQELLGALAAPSVQNLSPSQFLELAEKIEHLVSLDDHLLSHSEKVNFRPWGGYLSQLRDQKEHFESIAESFRMAVDDEALGILAFLAEDLAGNQSEHLVGAMHA